MTSHHLVDVTTRSSEWHSLTYLTDVHWDSAHCDRDSVLAVIDERKRDPLHRWIIGGDLGDWIAHGDVKRYVPSCQRADLRGKDSIVLQIVKEQAALLRGCRVDLVCPGNHEDEFLRRHEVDPTHALATLLGCQRGDYDGCVDYVVRYGSTKNPQRARVRVIYHHGAWGGGVGGGVAPAFVRWADQSEGWHFAVSGHNHRTSIDRQVRRDYAGGREVQRPCYYVVAGTGHASGGSGEGDSAPYATRRGLRSTVVGFPMLQWRYTKINSPPYNRIDTRVIA